MGKPISITFALNAALGSGFAGAFKTAKTLAGDVAASTREMEKSSTGTLGVRFASQKEKLKNLAASLQEAKGSLASLKAQEQAAGGANALLARQIELADQKVRNLTGSLKSQQTRWKTTVAEITTANGSIHELSRSYSELNAKIAKNKNLSKMLNANTAMGDQLRAQRADLQGRLLSTVATTASVALPVKLAISAEDTFADLKKVMDGASEEMLAQIFTDAQAMSSRTGKSFEDIVAIMTAGAQAGLGKTREELLGVADQAVKMSIAWGVSAEEAGKSLAAWQASMGLTAQESSHVANVINALSNSMAAEAGEINSIFTRMGAMMKSSGVAAQDIAALAAAFKAAGADVSVAGTAMKNFTSVLAAGKSGLTDAQLSLMKFIRIDPNELQKEFYHDSKKAIMSVLEALKNNVNPEELGSVAMKLFGKESIAAISPLIEQMEVLKQANEIANSNVDSSVNDEYASRMRTTATAVSQMSQSMRNLAISAGQSLLPVVGAVSKGISVLANTVKGFVDRFPGLSAAVMGAGAVIAGLVAGTFVLGIVMNGVKSGLNSVTGLYLRMAASQTVATASTTALGTATTAAGAGARFLAGGLRSIMLATGIGAVIAGLSYGVTLLIDHWDEVVAAMRKGLNWLTETWGRLNAFFEALGNNLSNVFTPFWEKVTALAVGAKNIIVTVWTGLSNFFGVLCDGIAGLFTEAWNGILSVVFRVWNEITGLWNGAAAFFSGIVDSISNVFSGFFDWLKKNFSWIFSAVDTVSGFIGKVTGAFTDAWNTTFGDKGNKPAENLSSSTSEGAASTAISASSNPAVNPPKIEMPKTDKPRQSLSDFLEEEKGLKKSAGKKGGSGGGGRRTSGLASGSKKDGPITVVTLGGDNSRPITTFIPAGSASGLASRKEMNLPQASAKSGRILNRTKAVEPEAKTVNFTQNFDIMTSDPATFRKVMESLRPDFEALVRLALAKIASDRARTAYSQ